jgi:hypothetical protein
MLGLIGLPYLFASRAGEPDYTFSGFLFNPLDGNSYLAKMYEGWRGDWRFTLPYTAETGDGTYLFLFYIFLGHIAFWLDMPIPVVYHLARLLCSSLMLLALFRFFLVFLANRSTRILAFILAALGSGLGWLAAMFAMVSSDFWVAEAYPFLSAYATPHFSLGLALLLFLFVECEKRAQESKAWRIFTILILSLALSIVSPFGIVIALTVLGALLMWEAWQPVKVFFRPGMGGWRSRTVEIPLNGRRRSLSLACSFSLILLAGAPFLIYDQWVASTNPFLAGWNLQNLTPSPSLLDLVISFSPALLFACVGAWAILTHRVIENQLFVAWAIVGLVLLFAPFGLQRRFIMGLFVPLSGLAALGLKHLAAGRRRRFMALGIILIVFSLPTTWLVLLSAQHAAQTHEPLLYLTRGEQQALNWLEANTPANALVLAGPDTGLFIPAQTGRRVLYGHPFETVDAQTEKANVTEFFLSGGEYPPLIAQFPIDYVLVGPRENKLGDFSTRTDLQAVYQADGVTIYAVER